jgi:hypothetical protein
MTPTNPNRFLHGLSDVSQIVDKHCAPETIVIAPLQPQVTINTSSGSGSGLSSSLSETWIELEFRAQTTGPQNQTLTHTLGTGYFLFVNGLKQSRTAFTVQGSVLMLLEDSNIEEGDLVCFSYSTTDSIT